MRSAMEIMRRFGRDENGTIVAEAVIVLPMMLWAYLALFVYWDAFRSVNAAQKAAYTIADVISRDPSTTGLPASYIPGLRNTMRYLIDHDQVVKIRVTSISWSAVDSKFKVEWSRSPDNAMVPLTTTSLQLMKSRIPNMADGDTVVLVETEVYYKPAFNVGLTDEVFKQFIITRPRVLPRICLVGVVCS